MTRSHSLTLPVSTVRVLYFLPPRQHRYPHLADAEANNLSSERGSDFPGATQLITRSQGGLLMALKSLCSQPPVTLSLGEDKKRRGSWGAFGGRA